jgi:tetratricopeptide (TPR) repeat protein
LFSFNLCHSRRKLRKNIQPSQTVNQYFVRIVAELLVMALSAKVYVLLIVTIKEGVMRDWMNMMLSILLCTTPSLFVVHAVAAQDVNQEKSQSWPKMLDQAKELGRKEKYQAAEALYRQILAPPRPADMDNDTYYNIQIQLATILQAQGGFTEAIAILRKVISVNSLDDDLKRQAQNTLERVAEAKERAIQNVAKGLQQIKKDITDDNGYETLAQGLAAQGELINGLSFLEKQLGVMTPDIAVRLAIATKNHYSINGLHYGDGYRSRESILQDGITLFYQIVKRYPNHLEARMKLLEVLDYRGTPTETIAAYRAEILRQPTNNYLLYVLLASSLEDKGQVPTAIMVYEELLAKGLFQPLDYVRLGGALTRNNQPDRALQIYLQGIKAFPEDRPTDPRMHVIRITSYDQLVSTLAAQKRLDQILPILEKNIPSPSLAIYLNLSLALCGKYPDVANRVNQRIQERYPKVNFSNQRSCWQ